MINDNSCKIPDYWDIMLDHGTAFYYSTFKGKIWIGRHGHIQSKEIH